MLSLPRMTKKGRSLSNKKNESMDMTMNTFEGNGV
jgi:hypothetical protein